MFSVIHQILHHRYTSCAWSFPSAPLPAASIYSRPLKTQLEHGHKVFHYNFRVSLYKFGRKTKWDTRRKCVWMRRSQKHWLTARGPPHCRRSKRSTMHRSLGVGTAGVRTRNSEGVNEALGKSNHTSCRWLYTHQTCAKLIKLIQMTLRSVLLRSALPLQIEVLFKPAAHESTMPCEVVNIY